MNGDQAVPAGRGTNEGRPQPWLELVEAAPQGEERGVHRRVGRVVAEEAGMDQVAGGRRFRALGEEQDQRGLLLGKADVTLAHLYGAAGGIELEAPEAIAPGPPGAPLDQARGEVGVDVRHRHVALDEVRAGAQLVGPADGGRVHLRRREDDHGQPGMVLTDPGQQLEPRVLVLVQHEIEEHSRDPLMLEDVARFRHIRGYRRSVTEIVQVDPELLQHRGLVLHHEDGGAENIDRTVDLEPRRQRRQPDLAPCAVARSMSNASVFQDPSYIIINEN